MFAADFFDDPDAIGMDLFGVGNNISGVEGAGQDQTYIYIYIGQIYVNDLATLPAVQHVWFAAGSRTNSA